MTSPARPGAARRTRKSPLAAQAAALALALKAVVLTALVGCRGGIDDPCRCASDCRAGLVCSAEGEKILEPNVCYESGVNGLCVPAEVQDSDSGPVVITEAPVYMDMASRRDFQPGGGVSESLSDATTDDTTTGMTATDSGSTTETTTETTTATTTDPTGSTGSTGSTSTGSTGSTGDTSTGSTGSTGDTDTSTGTSTGSTGSTGDSSSGSSGSSSTT